MALERPSWFRIRARRLVPPTIPWRAEHRSRPRVLLECPAEASPGIVASVLDRAGFDVVVCEGPVGTHRCPLAAGEGCPTVHAVDVVVNMLGSGSPEQAEVLPALGQAGARPPAVVAMIEDPAVPWAGAHTVGRRVSGPDLVKAVGDAAGGDRGGDRGGGDSGERPGSPAMIR